MAGLVHLLGDRAPFVKRVGRALDDQWVITPSEDRQAFATIVDKTVGWTSGGATAA